MKTKINQIFIDALAIVARSESLSQNDRDQIQAEVSQLTSEIDNIATSTHFNNIKLLNGDNSAVTFQIGINEEHALNVALEKSDSASLGLTGSTGVGVLTSGRMLKTDYSGASLAASDVKINGFDESFIGWGREDSDLVVRLINNGVRRKEGNFATGVYHLWHKLNSRDNFSQNDKLLNQAIELRKIKAIKGLYKK